LPSSLRDKKTKQNKRREKMWVLFGVPIKSWLSLASQKNLQRNWLSEFGRHLTHINNVTSKNNNLKINKQIINK
jgi:hypothetical protein